MSDSSWSVFVEPFARAAGTPAELSARIRRLESRSKREQAARKEAEQLLESKSLELFDLNQALLRMNNELESRVAYRTRQLNAARRAALKLVATDHLTKAHSRTRLNDRLNRLLTRAEALGGAFSLLMLDVDRFKQINDGLGHGYGDGVLIELSRRLRGAAGGNHFVARLGGDEFAIILENTGVDDALAQAKRLSDCFKPLFTVAGVTMKCRGSFGIACYPAHGSSLEELLRAADLALYKAKAEGRGRTALFDPILLDQYKQRERSEAALRQSIEREEIEAWFQPIVALGSGRTLAVETLARWQESDGQYLAPESFIPLAEECGLIRDLGRQLLRKAISQARHWVAAGLIDKVSVNVCPQELLDPGFADEVLAALNSAPLDPRHLVLEITESAMLTQIEVVEKVMARLAERGICFALDDFGCGYTNLAYLRRLPISTVKLDLTLLERVEEDEAAQLIVQHVVSLSHGLGAMTVGEGVETVGQRDFLRSVGCDGAQGFLYSKPLRAAEAEQYLVRAASKFVTGGLPDCRIEYAPTRLASPQPPELRNDAQ